MPSNIKTNISAFLDKLKKKSESYKGYQPFEDLMQGLSDGTIDFKWEFGGRLRPHHEPIRKPDSPALRYLLSAPFIYLMIIPTLFLDITVSLYQAICFRLWEIPKVKRRDYVVVDRHRMKFLSRLEKINCMYCGYTNGVYTYAKMVAGETERYWCPVKHEDEIQAPHKFYIEFAEYNNEAEWERMMEERQRHIEAAVED